MGLSDLIGRIQKKYGKDAVVSDEMEKVDFLHSGSFILDRILGGGWAKGRIVEVYGPESCAKTTLALHAAIEMQKTGKAVGYVDTEQALDPDYMQALGLDMSPDKFVLSQPNFAEDALEIVKEMCSEESIGLVVLDSVAGLVCKAEAMGEAGDAKIGLTARLMSSQLKILKNICKDNNCILFCINQLRDKIGGGLGYGPTTTTTGGKALRFYATQRIDMARIGGDKEGEEFISNIVRVKCQKNKVYKPFGKCEITILFGYGLDIPKEILELACEYGICEKKGSWYSYGKKRLGQGLIQTRDYLVNTDPAVFEEIYKLVKSKEKEI